MLSRRDTDVVKEWLAVAIERGRAEGKTPAGLAAHCGVTQQAVTGWLATGRITKLNLTKASQYFGHSPVFVVAGDEPHFLVRERTPAYGRAWPFPLVPPHRLAALDAATLRRLEALLLSALALIDA